MAVAIRLSRGGSKKRPFYRIVVADVRSPRDGRFIERIGTYNPMKAKDDDQRVLINKDRVKYWLSVGAKPTDRVAKFLFLQGIGNKPVIHEQTKKHKPKPKTLEKIKAKEEKIKTKEASQPTENPEKKSDGQPVSDAKDDKVTDVQTQEASQPTENPKKKSDSQPVSDVKDNKEASVEEKKD